MPGPDRDAHDLAGGLAVPQAFSVDSLPAPDGFALLVLSGEVDLSSGERFRELFAGARDAGTVIIDLSGVEFMDSTMLRELLRAHRAMEEAGGRLVLVAPQAPVRRLLDLTDTTALFEIAGSREKALA